MGHECVDVMELTLVLNNTKVELVDLRKVRLKGRGGYYLKKYLHGKMALLQKIRPELLRLTNKIKNKTKLRCKYRNTSKD